MAFDFPASPSVGQVFTPVAGIGYQWNGYAWDRLASSAPPVTAVPTPADDQVAVWTSSTALEGTAGLTFDSVGGKLKVAYPGGQILTLAPQAAGNAQVQIYPDIASPVSDVALLFTSKGVAGLNFYTSSSGSVNFAFPQVGIVHQVNTAAVLNLSGGEPTTNPAGNISLGNGGPIQILNPRFIGVGPPTIANAPALGDSSDKVPTTAWVQAMAGFVPQEGFLTFTDSTHLRFAPYKGNRIKINGKIYAIPTAGIVGLTNTNTYVNGVSGQSLANGTVYYVYAFISGGVITADFSTTAYAISPTVGNEGVVIKTNDDTRTLIGMIRTTTGNNLFYDTGGDNGVRSWFNRRMARIAIQGQNTFYSPSVYTPYSGTISMLIWADEWITALAQVGCSNDCSIAVNGGYTAGFIGYDGGGSGFTQANGFHSYGANWAGNIDNVGVGVLGEGFHTFVMMGFASGGTSTFSFALYVNTNLL